MDALRKAMAVFAAVIMALCVVPVASEDSDALGPLDGLLIYEVNPRTDSEGFSLKNYGTTSVDLADYAVADRPDLYSGSEGYVQFNHYMISPGEVVTFTVSIDPDLCFTNRGNTIFTFNGDMANATRNFALSNSGDDLYLFRDGVAIDAMCYGNKTITDTSLWFGEPMELRGNNFLVRTGVADTDSLGDWKFYGETENYFESELAFDADVTPFLFPDSGGIPIYQALENATESVYIAIYMLTNSNIYALLCDLESRGVEVTVLLEGRPLGYSVTDQGGYIKTLIDAGGEVRLIGVGDIDRYDYHHAKYAIIDMDTVIVTSENWTNDNTNGSLDDDPYSGNDGNRGWGVVVESEQYARYMYDNVFSNDYSKQYGDVKDFLELYPNAESRTITYRGYDDVEFDTYAGVQVTPVMSNDSSYEAMWYYISNATERVYAEQQSLTQSYMDSDEGPIAYMKERADAGVDVRVIFGDNATNNVGAIVDQLNMATNIQAANLSNPYVHNKGLVCDDYVWVSSVNWTTTSFHNNREMAVVIHDPEVADYYADAFLADFEECYKYEGIHIDLVGIESSYDAGMEIPFTANVDQQGDYIYQWDFGDGSAVRETTANRVAHTPIVPSESTTYELTVKVLDADTKEVLGEISKRYDIIVDGQSVGGNDQPSEDTGGFSLDSISEYLYLIIPIIVILLGIIGAASRSSKKSSKKGGRKKR